MNEKDLLIYNEIANVANDVFNNLDIEVGTYAPADVEKYFFRKPMAFVDGFDSDKIYTVTVGTFSCSFPADGVFYLLKQVATAWGIKQAFRAKFVRKPKQADNVVSFDVPKAAKEVAKAVAKEAYNPVLDYACIDTEKRCLVASDGHIMTVVSVPDMAVCEDAKKEYLVTPEVLKSGKGTLNIFANETIENAGKVSKCAEDYVRGYVNWRGVCPMVSESEYISLAGVWKEFIKEIKTATKLADSASKGVVLSGVSGGKHINIEAGGRVSRLELLEAVPFDFKVKAKGTYIMSVPQSEKLYFSSGNQLIFVFDGGFSLIMPQSFGHDYNDVGIIPGQNRKKPILELCGIDTPKVAPVTNVVENVQAQAAFDTVLCLPSESSCKMQLPAVYVGEYRMPVNPFASRWAMMPEVPQFAEVVQYTEDGREILPEPPAEVYIDIDALQTQDEQGLEDEKHENVFAMFTNWLLRVAAIMIMFFFVSAGNRGGEVLADMPEPQTFTEVAQDVEVAQVEEVAEQQATPTPKKVVKRKRVNVADADKMPAQTDAAHDDEVAQPVGSICMVAAFYGDISPQDAPNVYGCGNVLLY